MVNLVQKKEIDFHNKNIDMSIVKNVKMIDVWDWDKLVEETYGRTYCFQQQDDCRGRGIFDITIP